MRGRATRRFSTIAALAAALAVWLGGTRTAGACYTDQDVLNCLKLDRVEATPSWLTGLARVQIYVSAVSLHGLTVDVTGDHSWELMVSGSKKKLPYLVGTFANVEDPIAIAFVIELSQDYETALPRVREAAVGLLEKLPKETRVAVIGYGEELYGQKRKVVTVKKATSELESLESETMRGENKLLEGIERAIKLLSRARPRKKWMKMRKMIVVVSDGHDVGWADNRDQNKKNFRKLAERAEHYHIPIHSMAHSPYDDRSKMLGLAELSKITHGTFRLVRDAPESFKVAFNQLLTEIERQYVLTFYVPIEEIENRKLKVSAIKLQSNPSPSTKLLCDKRRCSSGQFCYEGACVSRKGPEGRGFFGWLLLILGILLGGAVVLAGVGFVLGRLGDQGPVPPPDPEAMQAAEQAAAPNRIAPQDAYGRTVQPGVGRTTGHVQPGGPVAPGRQTIQPQGGHVQPAGRHTAGPAARPVLFVVSGPHQGSRIPLRHGFSIGKSPSCDLSLPSDPFASSVHAQILMDKAGNCTLVDQNSTNGTFINGVRASNTRLQHGMLIRVGQSELRFMSQ